VLFSPRQSRNAYARSEVQSALVDLLLGVDELGRRRILLLALQTGELRKSEAADFLRLLYRLESAGKLTTAPDRASADS
jgi:hypothetical protein